MGETAQGSLLRRGHDPAPVEVLNAGSDSLLLLVCEHAGNAIPAALGTLGLSEAARAEHIALDIGAGAVTRALASRFSCRAVLQPYSRLVIDSNRPPGVPTSIPEASDGTPVPGNTALSPEARRAREEEIFAPFAARCLAEVARPGLAAAISIHSFTPVMDGRARPWDIGFLYRRPESGGARLAALCERLFPDLTVGRNEPYSVEDETDWFVPVCAEPRGIAHALIEIRNDHLRSDTGCLAWVDRLHRLIAAFLEDSP